MNLEDMYPFARRYFEASRQIESGCDPKALNGLQGIKQRNLAAIARLADIISHPCEELTLYQQNEAIAVARQAMNHHNGLEVHLGICRIADKDKFKAIA